MTTTTRIALHNPMALSRLEVYDKLRDMHHILKDIQFETREDNWEENVLDTVAGVLYMAESEFARDLDH